MKNIQGLILQTYEPLLGKIKGVNYCELIAMETAGKPEVSFQYINFTDIRA